MNIRVIILALFALLLGNAVIAQDRNEKDKLFKVYYQKYYNGENIGSLEYGLQFHDDIVFLSDPESAIRNFINLKENKTVSVISYKDELYCTSKSFDSLAKPDIEKSNDTILGYNCKVATYKVFSNTIKVWFTDKTEVKGSPYAKYLPAKDALAMKIMVNGNFTIIADSIVELVDESIQKYPEKQAKKITEAEFEELRILSRYTSMSVFKDETVNFDPDHWKGNEFDSVTGVYHYSKGAVVLKKIKVPEIVKNGANIFARLTCSSNGDAYDRTGSVFLIEEKENTLSMINAMVDSLGVLPKYYDNNEVEYQGIVMTDNYNPPIEIMRFFTSFGAGHFNKLREINNYPWEDKAYYKQDITNVFPVNADEVWVGVFIGNYDKGGHSINLDFDFYPSFDDTKSGRWVQPTVSTVNILEMSQQQYGRLFNNDTLKTEFNIPDSVENVKLYFTTTGHGGWGGGDEFNPKLNKVLIDGKTVLEIIPWRTDCATYRLINPASGNFGNGMSSSDLSRSNWCPGTLTPPYIISLDSLVYGNHKIEIIIDQGDDEGGSFNHWSVSAILAGDIEKNQ